MKSSNVIPSRWRKRAAGATAGGVGVAAKSGLLWKVLLALKGLAALGKVKMLASMIFTVIAYSWIYGWKYAAGFVALIFIHEMGHVFAFRLQGVKVSLPTFIPFLGAFVKMGETKTVTQEAVGAIGGPVLGTAGAGLVYLGAEATGSNLMMALAYAGFLINLFNLLPVPPLDGGRITAALHPSMWLAGMVAAVALMMWHPSVILGLVIVFGGLETWRRFRDMRRGARAGYYEVVPATRLMLGLGYVAIAAVCVAGIAASYVAA